MPAPVAARTPVVRSNASRERPVRSQETSCQWSFVFKEWASLSAADRVLRRLRLSSRFPVAVCSCRSFAVSFCCFLFPFLLLSKLPFCCCFLLLFPVSFSCFFSCCCLKFLFPVPGFPVPVPLLIFPDPIQRLLVSILVEKLCAQISRSLSLSFP